MDLDFYPNSRHDESIGWRMLSNDRDITLSVDTYCSVFNAERYDYCGSNLVKVGSAPIRILNQIVKTGYTEHDYRHLRVLPTVKV